MDKFEKMIKQSVEGYEAPFNPQAWENVSKELPDSFDHMMKDATGNYEAPFNPAAWDAVSSQLGSATSAWKWIAGAAAVVAVVAGSVYLFNTTQENATSTSSQNNAEVVVNDNDNTSEDVVTLSNDENGVEADHENVVVSDENGQELIHHIPNDLNVEISPLDEENVEEGLDHNDQDGNNESTVDQTEENNHGTNTNSGHTSNSGTVNIPVNPGFTMSSAEICKNGTCVFNPDVVINEFIYIWNFGDGSISNNKVATHKFLKAGEFTVSLEVKHPQTNKTLASSTETITVHELPATDFKWEKSNEIIPTINFINLTNEGAKWAWDVKGLKKSNKNEFEYTFRKAGNYIVELTAQNENGCSKSIQKTITIEEDYNLLAPTAFNPNGDGNNDFFIPEALKIMDVDFTMTVMDKSGKLVYTTQSAFEPWDGRYTEDNRMAENGSSYIWTVVLTNNNGEEEMYQGQVFVIR